MQLILRVFIMLHSQSFVYLPLHDILERACFVSIFFGRSRTQKAEPPIVATQYRQDDRLLEVWLVGAVVEARPYRRPSKSIHLWIVFGIGIGIVTITVADDGDSGCLLWLRLVDILFLSHKRITWHKHNTSDRHHSTQEMFFLLFFS